MENKVYTVINPKKKGGRTMEKDLLSFEALAWLKDNDYAHADHETRMSLIAEAWELFPH